MWPVFYNVYLFTWQIVSQNTFASVMAAWKAKCTLLHLFVRLRRLCYGIVRVLGAWHCSETNQNSAHRDTGRQKNTDTGEHSHTPRLFFQMATTDTCFHTTLSFGTNYSLDMAQARTIPCHFTHCTSSWYVSYGIHALLGSPFKVSAACDSAEPAGEA